ncbi:hypothetical protein CMT41_17430 [Colwellia sp. MT41]|uniref:hypothetical protein n=1 Tax=Colwellia sp. MT41 TaxID=58049 RepID=UPI000717ADC8|nr:hypothetical protein [Colwellia sp. MT41]ALO36317.1 hypothetical protein CMT41_17430 [Colwellia sp. MT41]
MNKTFLVISLIASCLSSMANADEIPANNAATSIEALGIELSLGGSYTQLKGFSGEGYNISAKVNILEGLISKDKEIPVNFYGKFSYQTSHDDSENNSYFDETELVLGVEYLCCQQYKLFIEAGDIRQNFEQGNTKLWQDYGYVYRAGVDVWTDILTVNVALEHRNSITSDTGYRATLTTRDGLFTLSYTDVGDYQSLMLNVNKRF